MTAHTREVTWGEALVVEVFRQPGGLKYVSEMISREIGSHIGTRNTFAKLLKVEDPTTLGERDRFRAWLLLTAFGCDPLDWGMSDEDVPPSLDPHGIRVRLREQIVLWAPSGSNRRPTD